MVRGNRSKMRFIGAGTANISRVRETTLSGMVPPSSEDTDGAVLYSKPIQPSLRLGNRECCNHQPSTNIHTVCASNLETLTGPFVILPGLYSPPRETGRNAFSSTPPALHEERLDKTRRKVVVIIAYLVLLSGCG